MSCLLRKVIYEKIFSVINQKNVYYELQIPQAKFQNLSEAPLMCWKPSNDIKNETLKYIASLDFDKSFVRNVNLIPATAKTKSQLAFELQPQKFVETLLKPRKPDILKINENIVFEFSSPNIAKPFHVGHLRSTIIGTVLANIYQYLGYNVTKLNYLGDWGTQLGMLQVGLELQDISNKDIQKKPIKTLYSAYVTANSAAKADPNILEKARHYFTELESGLNIELTHQWQQYRKYTIMELEQLYSRLGVHFDQYDWESQYSQKHICDIVYKLQVKSLLYEESDGRKIVKINDRRVPVIKSDGSTLYLARDIAALVDRFERYNFTHIFYVVDNAQTDHFKACFHTTAALHDSLTPKHFTHVKFGRIRGMSTRSGNAVFLRDVLDEARDIMYEKQFKSLTTKVHLVDSLNNCKIVADTLGVSAVVINDLKQRRQRDYDFDWNKILQVNGDTGIKLQYTHCRLHSLLQQTTDIIINGSPIQIEHLLEPEAQNLIFEIARFEQIIWKTKQELEPCILVNYLFALCNATSRALKKLKVKSEPLKHKQQNRIYLFKAAKDVLKKGMLILGLKPLDQM